MNRQRTERILGSRSDSAALGRRSCGWDKIPRRKRPDCHGYSIGTADNRLLLHSTRGGQGRIRSWTEGGVAIVAETPKAACGLRSRRRIRRRQESASTRI